MSPKSFLLFQFDLILRIKQKLRTGELSIAGDQWPVLLYSSYKFHEDDPWRGLLRSTILLKVVHASDFFYTTNLRHFQTYKHIFTSPSSVEREAKATRSGNARIHGMTRVTPASIAYAATQVNVFYGESLLGTANYFLISYRPGSPYRPLRCSPALTPQRIPRDFTTAFLICWGIKTRPRKSMIFLPGGIGWSSDKFLLDIFLIPPVKYFPTTANCPDLFLRTVHWLNSRPKGWKSNRELLLSTITLLVDPKITL